MSTVRRRTVLSTALTAAVTSAGLLPAAAEARRTPPPGLEPAHHDVLFVGAHPDDELLSFCALGQWRERYGWKTGVVTVTRGEGGGNAMGTEEGPELGLIREAEEREATALAGIRNIFYLDKPDFSYTLSAPLTARIWDEPDTLERIVRLIRETTPHTVVTMDPRPFDQHGGHQLSARLAVEAFRLAGDPDAFPRQLAHEGLKVWQPGGCWPRTTASTASSAKRRRRSTGPTRTPDSPSSASGRVTAPGGTVRPGRRPSSVPPGTTAPRDGVPSRPRPRRIPRY
ncbi:PIG-L family deacetylase [Streptomyces sp. NPDC086010]|uniref:PIG-L family deacetylase n=1 Tax=Streptomyces sp. NPDC086010 TaxID=3365745 RepID=UPI0037D375F4